MEQVYRRRRPRSSGLWRILQAGFKEFRDVYEERFEGKHGFLRKVVIRRIHEFLKCGILDYGFARVRCRECRHEYLVAFSCKVRGFCPSCQAKRQAEFAAFLTDEVLVPVPHRQVVLSFPGQSAEILPVRRAASQAVGLTDRHLASTQGGVREDER